MAKAGSASCLEKRRMGKLPNCDTFLKKEKVVCVQFFSLRIGQWRSEAAEVNIQRHRLTIRDKDMFNGT